MTWKRALTTQMSCSKQDWFSKNKVDLVKQVRFSKTRFI